MQKNYSGYKGRMGKKLSRLLDVHPSDTDPLGSYTGMPADPGETPVQDADDL